MTVKPPGQKERLTLAEKALDDIRAVLGGDGGDIILRGVCRKGSNAERSGQKQPQEISSRHKARCTGMA